MRRSSILNSNAKKLSELIWEFEEKHFKEQKLNLTLIRKEKSQYKGGFSKNKKSRMGKGICYYKSGQVYMVLCTFLSSANQV